MNEERFLNIERRIEDIEFRQQLLFQNDDLSRLLFEYNINKEQYMRIMDLMDKYRNAIENNENVNHSVFEDEIYKIVPEHKYDYHMCENIAQTFMENKQWEEVFQTLYGDMPKYKHLVENGDE